MESNYGNKNVYLVGLMGAGKTTLGRALARRLDLQFIDSDREIEARTGVSIPTIFEIEGEEGFRKREARVIGELAQKSGQVVATGGGAVLRPENRRAMRASGLVFFLNVPPRVLWERTRHDRNRPLLQVPDPLGRLQQLSAEREPYYREIADLVVESGCLTSQGVLQMMIHEIGERWKH